MLSSANPSACRIMYDIRIEWPPEITPRTHINLDHLDSNIPSCLFSLYLYKSSFLIPVAHPRHGQLRLIRGLRPCSLKHIDTVTYVYNFCRISHVRSVIPQSAMLQRVRIRNPVARCPRNSNPNAITRSWPSV